MGSPCAHFKSHLVLTDCGTFFKTGHVSCSLLYGDQNELIFRNMLIFHYMWTAPELLTLPRAASPSLLVAFLLRHKK
jgi:hypothetical protein